MDNLTKGMNHLIELLVMLALLAVIGIPAGHWIWGFVTAGNNALGLLGLVGLGFLAKWSHHHHGHCEKKEEKKE